jgi:hypothetical protein
MPPINQYLLLYVLDLLSVFARKSDKNLMNASSESSYRPVLNQIWPSYFNRESYLILCMLCDPKSISSPSRSWFS